MNFIVFEAETFLCMRFEAFQIKTYITKRQ